MNNMKFADSQQAKAVYNYKNTKEKLCKINAYVLSNKIYKTERFAPKYIQVKDIGYKTSCF
jgi:hypothetical protein